VGIDFAEPIAACPICGHRGLRADFSLPSTLGPELQWYSCLQCGFTFMNPRLMPHEMVKIYNSTEYWQEASYKDYIDGEPVRLRNAEQRLASCASRLPASGTLLDIGTATGFMAAAAHARGYRVIGFDPARRMVEFGRRHYGLDLRVGTIESMAFEPGQFDIVSLWGTDSHFFDVRESFGQIATWLRPGGILLFGYQDYSHWIRRLFPRIKQGVNVYYNFTRDALARLIPQLGLHIVEQRTDWQVTQVHRITRTLSLGRRLLAPLDAWEVRIPAISYKVAIVQKTHNPQ
jgi:SAM-dependent methyltransferase